MAQSSLIILLATLQLSHSAFRTAKAANAALKDEAMKKLCYYSLKAKGQTARIMAKLSALKTTAAEAAAKRDKMNLFSIRQAKFSAAAQILAIYFHTKLTAALTEIKTTIKPALAVVSQAACSAGRIDESMGLWTGAQHSDGNSNYCVSNAKTPSAWRAEHKAGCTSVDVGATPAAEDDLQALLTTNIKKTTDITGRPAASCKLTAAVASAYGPDSGNFQHLGGLIVIGTAGDCDTNNFKQKPSANKLLQKVATTFTAHHTALKRVKKLTNKLQRHSTP
uniref:Variant surface glycoprotein n=1 Tax=Trypanosoma brucei TaxID=5691 RepID=A0A1V0FZF5_9TRYP|nr:variant surface glycoprotein [Trypanosoma brucei]